MSMMILIPGGHFFMGSDDHYAEERPVRLVEVEPFYLDATPVTNRAFRAFVKATGYRTLAERKPKAKDYPGADSKMLRAGSAVFVGTEGPVPLNDHMQWWAYVPGASWKRPFGPKSTIAGREDHPVVHVAYEDAQAYARWCGKRLPSEKEWEFAGRGGLDRAAYAWGDELNPDGRRLANFWDGDFPWRPSVPGMGGTSKVKSYPANGFGLFDMIGNVWEWTDDWYSTDHDREGLSCCASRASSKSGSQDSDGRFGSKVVKGGSHLCAESYCRRYRPAARHPQMIDSTTSHIGFRCARDI